MNTDRPESEPRYAESITTASFSDATPESSHASASEMRLKFNFVPADLRAANRHAGMRRNLSIMRTSLVLGGPLLMFLGSIYTMRVLLVVMAGVMFGLLLIMQLRNFWTIRAASFDLERDMLLTPQFIDMKTSRSSVQILWQAFDEHSATQDHFLFKRHNVCIALPKRVMTESQQTTLERWLEPIDPAGTPVEQLQQMETPAHRELLSGELCGQIFEWTWEDQDIFDLAKARLKIYYPLEKGSKKKFWMYAYLVFLVVGVSYLSVVSDEPVLLMFIAPILLIMVFILYMWAIGHVSRWWTGRMLSDMKVKPRMPALMTTSNRGIIFSDKVSTSIHDWNDVQLFYCDKNLLAFHGVEKLLQAFPRRIFEGRSEAFLQMTNRLMRQAQAETAETKPPAFNAEIVETGNPFQAPSNQAPSNQAANQTPPDRS